MNPTAELTDRCQRRDALENRERIVTAAREAFAQDGVDVSLIEIARRAGVGNATLHRNFTKESLVEALFEEWFEHHRSAGEQALQDPDPWHGLTVFLEDVLADASRNRALLDIFMIRLHHRAGPAAGAVPPHAHLVRRAQESGDLRPDAGLEDLFLVFWGIGRTLSITGEASPEQSRRQLAIALEGLRARPGQTPLPGEGISNSKLDDLIGNWAESTLGKRRCTK
jgi:AcrR family transcriptional regulator